MAEPAQNQSEAKPDETPKPSSLSLVAQEAFGSNFHGEVREAPHEEPAPVDTNEPDADGTRPDDGGEGGDVDAEEPKDEAGQTKSAEPEGSDADEEVASIGELVQSLEADPEWFQGLQVDVTVNGNTSQVPFRDLVANYQMNQAAEAKLEQAKTKSAEAQQLLAQKNAALEAQFQTAGAIVEQAEQILQSDFQAIDWNALHEEDPAQWSAEKVRFSERQQQIAALKQHLAQTYQQSVAQRHGELSQQHQQFMAEQAQLLKQEMPKVSPDWGSSETLPTAKARLTDYLMRNGFSQEDINNAADHRLLVIAEKARLHDEARGKLDVTKKRLRKVPKVMKPGSPKPQGQVNLEQQAEARKRLARTGAIDDAVALLRAKRKG